MRIIVTGGRHYSDGPKLFRTLAAHRPTAIAHGGAKGADTLANAAALMLGCPVTEFPPQWNDLGRAAGPIRNQRMLDEFRPDLVLAFPGGRGTADMVRRAKSAGVPVLEVDP